jgi:hypothetical protein
MKISFDYDSCLSTIRIQKVAKTFIDNGHDVWVTTSRFSSEYGDQKGWAWIRTQNNQLLEITNALGIPFEKIQFCNMEEKSNFLHGFDMHFDDDDIDIQLIEENLPTCTTVLVLTLHKND